MHLINLTDLAQTRLNLALQGSTSPWSREEMDEMRRAWLASRKGQRMFMIKFNDSMRQDQSGWAAQMQYPHLPEHERNPETTSRIYAEQLFRWQLEAALVEKVLPCSPLLHLSALL